MSNQRIPSLDGVRGISALLVLWAHLPAFLLPGWLRALTRAAAPGYLGVDIFFVLSGFLITRVLLQYKEAGVPLKAFYIRRALRIFPAYYSLMAVLAILRPNSDLAWAATYTSNYFFAVDAVGSPLRHTWSLCVEEHFYLMWPLLPYFLTRARCTKTTVGILIPSTIAAMAATCVFFPMLSTSLLYHCTQYRALSLLLGCWLAMKEPAVVERSTLIGRLTAAALPVCAVAVVGAKFLFSMGWYTFVHQLAFATISTTIVAFCVATGRPRMLGAPRFASVGAISYGLYLYHYPLYFWLGLFDQSRLHTWSEAAAAVALTIAAAMLSYRLIESRALTLYRSPVLST
jgi:peptidoglycan/LPS O-acetylase OafA/YrhL